MRVIDAVKETIADVSSGNDEGLALEAASIAFCTGFIALNHQHTVDTPVCLRRVVLLDRTSPCTVSDWLVHTYVSFYSLSKARRIVLDSVQLSSELFEFFLRAKGFDHSVEPGEVAASLLVNFPFLRREKGAKDCLILATNPNLHLGLTFCEHLFVDLFVHSFIYLFTHSFALADGTTHTIYTVVAFTRSILPDPLVKIENQTSPVQAWWLRKRLRPLLTGADRIDPSKGCMPSGNTTLGVADGQVPP